ncbi:MlaD family protein [Temperatibacter marinus]|uniref:MlaD family protein n=1 Tax=Temperatibacter marinus TaxID=1456591 RepID=A0AA52ECS3_9PROT|nr:MlaD family protein [Temperatibacter marinus]WND03047.1 MlaD family protein [Temperatibacter marinus]
METRASHLLVGSFVLVFLAGLVAFAIWMAKVDPDAEYSDYDIYFTGSVSGLVNRGTVYYLGIPVGDVRRITLAPNPQEVRVHVRIRKEVQVNSQSRARLEFQGLTGVAYIEIMGGDASAPPLLIQEGQDFPVIQAESSNFQAIFDKAPNLVDEAIKAVGALQLLLNEENRSEVSGILKNTNRLTGNLAQGTEDLDLMVAEAKSLMQNVTVTLSKVNALADSGNELLAQDAKRLINQATEALVNINSMAKRMDQLVAANEGTVTTFVSGTLPEISRMIMDLRSTARALSRLTRKIEANPARVVFPPEPQKYNPNTGKVEKEK